MIVHVAGTSGSGKSHLVRAFIDAHGPRQPVYAEGRAAPLGYLVGGRTFVVGAYEAASSGGCDTFGGDGRVERTYALIREQHAAGRCVVYEGIMMMNHTRGIQLWRDTRDLAVLCLTTSLPECLEGVRQRRVAAGKPPEFSTKNTEDSFRRTQHYCVKLRQLGCPVHRASREEAFDRLMGLVA